MRDHKPRAQKRQEYKQVIGLLVLVLAVASVSFALGVTVGRRGVPVATAESPAGVRKAVTETPKPTGEQASPEDAPKVNLTFYDTLPKGGETPLGSGINPPPKQAAESVESAPAKVDEQPAPERTAKPAAAAEPVAPASAAKPPPVTSGEYVVQVASFKADEDARALQTRLLGKGHRAYLQRVDLGDKGVWSRVYVGFFNSAEAAKKVADRLAAEDRLSPMVRRRP